MSDYHPVKKSLRYNRLSYLLAECAEQLPFAVLVSFLLFPQIDYNVTSARNVTQRRRAVIGLQPWICFDFDTLTLSTMPSMLQTVNQFYQEYYSPHSTNFIPIVPKIVWSIRKSGGGAHTVQLCPRASSWVLKGGETSAITMLLFAVDHFHSPEGTTQLLVCPSLVVLHL